MTLRYRTLAQDRRGQLKAMLAAGRKLRAIEAHNPLSALIGSTASAAAPDGTTKEFDAIWLSGFTSAAARALPDAEPLLCIPTAYNFVTDRELFERGAAMVIHANHLLRAACQAMTEVSASILAHDRSREAAAFCVALPELFGLIGVGE